MWTSVRIHSDRRLCYYFTLFFPLSLSCSLALSFSFIVAVHLDIEAI